MNMILNKARKIGLIAYFLVIFTTTYGQIDTSSNSQAIPVFTIDFPKTENEVRKTKDFVAELGNILVTNWILQGKNENGPYIYFVAHNKFPEALGSQGNEDIMVLNTLFQASLKSSAVKLGGTDFKFTEIKYKNYLGMESICEVFKGEGFIKSRVFKIDNNLFIISAGGQHIDMKSVNAFLDSFRLN